ncbi:hypothetical protein DSECCO2_542880 [anaerobic digester metagenome]
MKVHIQNSQVLVVGIEYFIYGNIFVINRHVLELFERNAIQFVAQREYTFANIIETEIRTKHFFIQVIFFLADFLGIEPPVPRLQFEVPTFLINHFLHVGCFGFSNRKCSVPYRLQKIVCFFRRFGHVTVKNKRSVVEISQQFGALKTQGYYFGDNFLVVIFIVVVTAHEITLVDFLTQVATFRILQERDHAGFISCEQPFPVHLLFFCSF